MVLGLLFSLPLVNHRYHDKVAHINVEGFSWQPVVPGVRSGEASTGDTLSRLLQQKHKGTITPPMGTEESPNDETEVVVRQTAGAQCLSPTYFTR